MQGIFMKTGLKVTLCVIGLIAVLLFCAALVAQIWQMHSAKFSHPNTGADFLKQEGYSNVQFDRREIYQLDTKGCDAKTDKAAMYYWADDEKKEQKRRALCLQNNGEVRFAKEN